ncbi:uncharacterized PI3/PI4-kinase family protein C1F5.11c-like isoform X1 [Rutidosis leptorrhynchoides]|uniref:uncharacterized PI3/PI4-kinase family protein C1F5.11c-like isoform X1 n=1 Tax=Rutidosis leptorrhynchoides TaxID=125765 RepID=UPI003A99E41B
MDFKRGLFPLIDTLMEERVLIGFGRACFETPRPLAYSLLAEIVHHVRGDLSLLQLSRIIYLFSSNMHDASLSLSIHTTCARLMLNLVEPIFEKGVDLPSMDEARILLGQILDAFVGKFSTFKRSIPQVSVGGEIEDLEGFVEVDGGISDTGGLGFRLEYVIKGSGACGLFGRLREWAGGGW